MIPRRRNWLVYQSSPVGAGGFGNTSSIASTKAARFFSGIALKCRSPLVSGVLYFVYTIFRKGLAISRSWVLVITLLLYTPLRTHRTELNLDKLHVHLLHIPRLSGLRSPNMFCLTNHTCCCIAAQVAYSPHNLYNRFSFPM